MVEKPVSRMIPRDIHYGFLCSQQANSVKDILFAGNDQFVSARKIAMRRNNCRARVAGG
jgi:hypothetical protein